MAVNLFVAKMYSWTEEVIVVFVVVYSRFSGSTPFRIMSSFWDIFNLGKFGT